VGPRLLSLGVGVLGLGRARARSGAAAVSAARLRLGGVIPAALLLCRIVGCERDEILC